MNSVETYSHLAERLKALAPEKLARLKERTVSGLVSGSALVAEALRRCGLKRVFSIAGTPVDRIFSKFRPPWSERCRRCGRRTDRSAAQ
jgi:hypothetical protein